ncbi:MAG: hypothetical protein LKJ69_06725 [Lactobacillus sp.]|jgi:hypothetical protein|nr:hypothetical protein [Lactobacillus sp.]MCI2033083.1 hypothetical protein [Lactobacillus sp.]
MNNIAEGLDIHYRNVITGILNTDGKHLGEDIQHLLDEIAEYQTIVDDYMYVIESDFRQTESMALSMVVPIAEDKPIKLPQGYRFQSYYQLLDLVGSRVVDADTVQLQNQIVTLLEYLAEQDHDPATPLIMRLHQLNDHRYTEVYVGIAVRRIGANEGEE